MPVGGRPGGRFLIDLVMSLWYQKRGANGNTAIGSKAPRRRGGTRRRDLPQRTQHRRVMTESIPSKKRNGLPPWSVH